MSIEKHQAEFSIKAMYRVLRVAPWCQPRISINLRQRCPGGFYPPKQRYGAPRLTDELRAQD